MKNNFYSYWQREKKRYHDRDQQLHDHMNYQSRSHFENPNKDFHHGSGDHAHQDQIYYGAGYRDDHYNDRHQHQQNQQHLHQQNKWRGWDNSDKISNRNWWDKTTDEVAGWFGDDDAQRRRHLDKIHGPHRGKGPKGYERSDERIREDVSDRFYDDPYIDASDINITVTGKEVILEGTVDSKEAKRRAEYLAESIRGVKDVENRLKINRDSQNTRGNSDYRMR